MLQQELIINLLACVGVISLFVLFVYGLYLAGPSTVITIFCFAGIIIGSTLITNPYREVYGYGLGLSVLVLSSITVITYWIACWAK